MTISTKMLSQMSIFISLFKISKVIENGLKIKIFVSFQRTGRHTRELGTDYTQTKFKKLWLY